MLAGPKYADIVDPHVGQSTMGRTCLGSACDGAKEKPRGIGSKGCRAVALHEQECLQLGSQLIADGAALFSLILSTPQAPFERGILVNMAVNMSHTYGIP